MPITWGAKRKTTEPATEDTVSADQVDTLSPVEQMEMIERIAEATPIHAFPPVGLRKTGEVKELNIENWKKRIGYKPA
jgi:hypothetical protein